MLSGIEGKHVKITGRIEMYKGKPEIRINAASQLEVQCGEADPVKQNFIFKQAGVIKHYDRFIRFDLLLNLDFRHKMFFRPNSSSPPTLFFWGVARSRFSLDRT
jgi:hypothetical protein